MENVKQFKNQFINQGCVSTLQQAPTEEMKIPGGTLPLTIIKPPFSFEFPVIIVEFQISAFSIDCSPMTAFTILCDFSITISSELSRYPPDEVALPYFY